MTNHEEASPSAASRTESSEQLQSNINDDASSANSASDVDANVTSGSAEKRVHKCRADFIFLDELGEGSFSTVSRAREKSTDREFAIKVCYKKMIIRERKVHQIYREKEAMAILSRKENYHPFIVQIYCTFQDRDSLYIVMTLAKGGELLKKLKKYKKFDVDTARFYTSEIVSALSHMHTLNIVHRDLKPENILLAETGHILISDFGSARITDTEPLKPEPEIDNESVRRRKRLGSFVGTAQYVSPEVLNGEVVEQACDYWALGVILYQLLTGHHAFHDESEYLIYRKISRASYDVPEDMPLVARNLIAKLLVVDVSKRLGSVESGGAEAVKSDEFFEGVPWDNLESVQPPRLD
ncbi:3-phosphoinositide-dependent protein kinase 1 [Toxocara canis]|uniref:non-specific serine/threonine protein kinase n=1 Tax=Toxocara canis TaxID=6265 RepID=A0A0B2V1V6_TOXCA|nr:3-phosphoinositide-dependent protein kinase 1 [Toxocara canis]